MKHTTRSPKPSGDTSVRRVRSGLAGLATSGLGTQAFVTAALDLLGKAVPCDAICLATTDPETQLMTGSVKRNLPEPRDADFSRLEYEVPDVNKFREIAGRPSPVGVLAHDTDGRPQDSVRWREMLVPYFDSAHEMRGAFRSEGSTWGLVGMYRRTASQGFNEAEAEFLASVSGVVAAGLRAGLVAAAAVVGGVGGVDEVGPTGPAVLVVDGDDEVSQLTPAAQQRLAELGCGQWQDLPVSVLSIVGAARAFAAGQAATAPRARLRSPSGQWLVVHAAPLASRDGERGQVVVTVEPARPPEVMPLVVAAFGLSGREREVVGLVLRGDSTNEIARALHLSPYTVQDHLKAIFDKAGVRSRRELTARIFFDHYSPRYNSPVGPSGWFAASATPTPAGPRTGTGRVASA